MCVKKVENDDFVKFTKPTDVRLKLKPRMRYKEVLSMLLQGYTLLYSCDRRKANYIAKKLNELAERLEVNAEIEYCKAEFDGKPCYAFYVTQLVEL